MSTFPLDVPGYGRDSARYMLIGEAPGRNEYAKKRPFVGDAGNELRLLMNRHHIDPNDFWLTNVVKTYLKGNPDPTPELISYWSEYLENEIAQRKPTFIVACGRFALRWLLGEDAPLDECAGVPFAAGTYDLSYSNRAPGIPIIGMHHPAGGLWDVKKKDRIDYDVKRIGRYYRQVRTGRPLSIPVDEFAGRENYRDVTGEEAADILTQDYRNISTIAIDTEGIPGDEWSWQFCYQPGTAYVVRKSQSDWHLVSSVLQSGIDGVSLGGHANGWTVVVHDASTPHHGCCYETTMMRGFNVNLLRAKQINTMELAFELIMERRGLKSISWRFARIAGDEYSDLIGDIARGKQLEFLQQALDQKDKFPETEHVLEVNNDGTTKLKKPQALKTRISRTLKDVAEGVVDKDGNPVDPADRWEKIDKRYRLAVEAIVGRKFPYPSMNDLPFHKAIFYAAGDADKTLRVLPYLMEEIRQRRLEGLAKTRNKVIPIFAEIQNTGMPGSRKRFSDLQRVVRIIKEQTRIELSEKHYGGRTINPNAPDQVRDLMEYLGLEGKKRTATGEVSTGVKSIAHLRFEHPAIDLVFRWREAATVDSKYATPLLEIADEQEPDPRDPDYFLVHSQLDPCKQKGRRISAKEPSLLNQPAGRTEIGKLVRACYCLPQFMIDQGYIMGSWDSKGQEMRIAAHVSKDKTLIRLFQRGQDIHQYTASVLFGVPYDQVTPKQRRYAKTGNFGILYGQSGYGLQEQFRMIGVMLDLEECQRTVDEIKEGIFPGLGQASRDVGKQLDRTGVIADLFGMERYIPTIWSDEWYERAEAERQAFSHLISGTAQGCMQNSMVEISSRIWELRDYGFDISWLLQVHDEILLLLLKDHWDIVDPIVRDAFENHSGLKLTVPLQADCHYGTDWGALKG